MSTSPGQPNLSGLVSKACWDRAPQGRGLWQGQGHLARVFGPVYAEGARSVSSGVGGSFRAFCGQPGAPNGTKGSSLAPLGACL